MYLSKNSKMQGTPKKIKELPNDFKNWLERLGYANNTINGHRGRMTHFINHLKSKEITILKEVTTQTIKDYQTHLETLPISSSTIGTYISTLRLLDNHLEQFGYTPIITSKLKIIPHFSAPRTILNQQEIKQLYKQTDDTLQGFKDRAMLSIYYGCGLRATEGLNLIINDLDFKSNLIQVRKTKTYQPRYVPMSTKVQTDLKDWLHYGRPLVNKSESDYVLVHSKGKYKEAKGFNDRLKRLQELAGINKRITLHGLRHSIATHLLENEMKLEQIRQFLGHHSLEVTQRYTHYKI